MVVTLWFLLQIYIMAFVFYVVVKLHHLIKDQCRHKCQQMEETEELEVFQHFKAVRHTLIFY